jgi:hypothetical protein
MTESANGNACNRCQHSWSPREVPLDSSHCYMFKSEPRVCFQYKAERSGHGESIEPTLRERALALMDGCYMPYEQALELARSEADAGVKP